MKYDLKYIYIYIYIYIHIYTYVWCDQIIRSIHVEARKKRIHFREICEIVELENVATVYK